MNYLRYSSDEMFSSTELIRKSKKIFDKLNKKEIEKAIILRDGKPGFMLLDFATYEKIMKNYERLSAKTDKSNHEEYLSLDDIEVSHDPKNETKVVIKENKVAKAQPLAKAANIEKSKEQDIQLEDITQIEQMNSPEINDAELLKALEEIEKINISDTNTLAKPEINNSDFEDDFHIDLENIEKDAKAQPLKEFWDN